VRHLSKSLILFLLFTTMGCDQVTKHVAKTIFPDRTRRVNSIGMIHFEYAENSGGMLGLGDELPPGVRFWLLIVATGAGLTVMGWFLLQHERLRLGQAAGLTLMAGGGGSNLLDRLFNDGRVVDFMIVRLGDVQTGVFNVADVMIIVGFLLVARSFFQSAPQPHQPPQQ
jgi:signal peptidase II